MNERKNIAIIGAGISGLSAAQLLKYSHKVKVFESSEGVGGLVKCDIVDGILYHKIGGHVFNSRREEVLNWFWNFFDRETEFVKTNRNASIFLDKPIGYPIENYIYQLEPNYIKQIIKELLELNLNDMIPNNFEEFLKFRFGKTLYEIYFKPYNEKIWKKGLKDIPLSWLEGKLPMPTIEEILYNNFCKEQEMGMVHSSFYYPLKGGSQFIVDRLSKDLDIELNFEILDIKYQNGVWILNDTYEFEKIIYTGNIKYLPKILIQDLISEEHSNSIKNLEFHGTTSVLCQVDQNPYSWIYLPNTTYSSHRIINTGNFSPNNNSGDFKSCTVEFTDFISEKDIMKNLSKMPYSVKYISHFFSKYTYPIQNSSTKDLINSIKKEIQDKNFFLLGRFAEWEYYNMDAAMSAAIDLCKTLQ